MSSETSSIRASGDFWWLAPSYDERRLLVGLGCALRTPRFDDAIEIVPAIDFGAMRTSGPLYELDEVFRARTAGRRTNLFRTICLFDRDLRAAVAGPLYLDIDAHQLDNGSYQLEDAARATSCVLDVLRERQLSEFDDYRLLFTGHKGFNIEIRPESLGVTSEISPAIWPAWRQQITEIASDARRVSGTQHPCPLAITDAGCVIDSFLMASSGSGLRRPYLRLQDSVNHWAEPDGLEISRVKLTVTVSSFHARPLAELVAEAEKRAETL